MSSPCPCCCFWLFGFEWAFFVWLIQNRVSIFVWVRLQVLQVKNKLLPLDKAKYLALRYRTSFVDASFDPAELDLCGPVYIHHRVGFCMTLSLYLWSTLAPCARVQAPSKSRCCSWWIKLAYKTSFPNSHESLFWLWKRGPAALAFTCQVGDIRQNTTSFIWESLCSSVRFPFMLLCAPSVT